MANKNLLIIGAGQYGCVAKEVAQAMGCFEKIDFLDDHSSIAIGKAEELEKFALDYSCVFVAIGNPDIRLYLIAQAKSLGFTVISLVHPRGYVSPSAILEEGCIVEPCAVVQANACVRAGCLISAGAVVNHNALLEEGCHIDCNATVSARSVVKTKIKIGSGQVY